MKPSERLNRIAHNVAGYLLEGKPAEHTIEDIAAEVRKLEAVVEAAEELEEVAYHRGDNILPHPEDDPGLWTARMQTAWDELEKALADLESDD